MFHIFEAGDAGVLAPDFAPPERSYVEDVVKCQLDHAPMTDGDDDLAELEARVNDANLPEEADKAARKELRRLRNMSPSQAEYTVARTYVEWLCDLPWARSSMDKIDLKEVRDILGPPTSENEYVTGKAFVPFYYGPDRTRRGYFYKGMGRVVFAGGSGFNRTGKVSRVEYDPNETGAAR